MEPDTYLAWKQAFLSAVAKTELDPDDALTARVERLRTLAEKAKAEPYLAFKIQTMVPDLAELLIGRLRSMDKEVVRILERVLLLDQNLEEAALEWDMSAAELRPIWDFSLALIYEAYLETREPKINFFQQVKSLFQRALEVEPHQWQSFLTEYPTELQKEVQALLLAHVENERNLRDLFYVIKDSGPSLAAGRKIGKYRVERFLGKGGMGEVYLAIRHNPKLKVALKVLKPDWFSGLVSAQVTDRFLAFFRDEMQTLADLDHPSIAKFIDSGSTPGKRPYIVMDFIDGDNLTDYCDKRELGVRQRLGLFLKICDAVQHAHNRDIVHSDLKPGNILVTGDGEIKLLDFGISRNLAKGHRLGDSDQERSSAIGFTPPYAAPEQLRYKAPTRKSDIHALGVILFELLSGSLPYEGENREQLLFQQAKLLRSEAPHVSRDLEVIISACLEKEEEGRYGSVQELSQDLERHLAGKPVSLRTGELGYILGLGLRKYRGWFGVAAMVFIGFAGIIGISTLRGEWVAQLRETSTAIERDIVIVTKDPPRDLSDEWLRFEAQVAALEDWPALKKVLVGDQWYAALGKVYRVMKDFPKARDHLERALRAGGKNTEVTLALCYTYAVLYRDELRAKAQEDDWSAASFKEQALRLAGNADTVEVRKIRAWLSYFARDFQSAQVQIEALDTPWDFEIQLLRGDIATAAANEERFAGHYDEALKLFQKAEAAFQNAANMRRSEADVYRSWCGLYSNWMSLQSLPQEQVMRCFEEGVAMSKVVATIEPDNADSFLFRSKLHYRLHGQNSADSDLKWAREYIDRALELEPKNDKVLIQSSAVWRKMGRQHRRKDYYKKALRELERVQEPSYRLFNNLGLLHYLAAAEMGPDAQLSFEKGKRAYERAITLRPKVPATYRNLGSLYRKEAQFHQKFCRDPQEAFRRGAASFQTALALNPDHYFSHYNLANLLADWARAECKAGLGPLEHILEARSHHQEGLAHASENNITWLCNLGWNYFLEGVFLWNSGKDPEESFDTALNYLEKAHGKDPQNAYTLSNMGAVFEKRAEYAWRSGSNPSKLLKKAIDHQHHVLNSIVDNATEPRLARLYFIGARFRLEQGKAPQNLEKVREMVSSIKKDNPLKAERIQGELALLQAWEQELVGENPIANYEITFQSLEGFERERPCVASVHLLMAEGRSQLAHWRSKAGKNFKKELSAAQAHLDRALEINPRLARAYLLKAELCLIQVDWEKEAVVDEIKSHLDQVHKLNPHLDHLASEILKKTKEAPAREQTETRHAPDYSVVRN